ncbi:hypothetical protein C8F01DRAFT_923515, partial [Mycena amicta]
EELLIDFQEIVGEHSGENMAEVVWSTIERYGLEDKIFTFAMDNATNNDTLVDAIETKCSVRGIYFDVSAARIRCLPHTIHLA